MNQNRKQDRDMPNRQSNMEQAEGSRQRESGRGAGGERNSDGSERHRDSVISDKEQFEHGSGGSDELARGMGSASHERASGASDERNSGASDERNSGGITNRPLDREQAEQERLPDRGKSQSESER